MLHPPSSFFFLNTIVAVPPYAMTLSSTLYIPPLVQFGVIGNLTAMDVNCCDVFTYSLVGGVAAGDFIISGNKIEANVPQGLRGDSLVIVVNVNDGAGGSYQQSFSISESFDSICSFSSVAMKSPFFTFHSECPSHRYHSLAKHVHSVASYFSWSHSVCPIWLHCRIIDCS